jgi:hypothetical protein
MVNVANQVREAMVEAKIFDEGDMSEGDKGDRVLSNTPPIYKVFRELIKVYGKSYEPVKKALFYSLIGNVLKPAQSSKEAVFPEITSDVLKHNMIRCGSIVLDTRINLFIPMKSGHGKKAFEETTKRTMSELELKHAEPTSLHSEQLVGKTVYRNDRVILNLGYFSYDYLVVNEAIEFLTESHHQDGRDYTNKALDTIGQNEVMKRAVDVLEGEEIRYNPVCSVMLFFQPLNLDSHLVTRGLLRRGVIPYIDTPTIERTQALFDSLFDTTDPETNEDNWKQWIVFLKNLSDRKWNWVFQRETIEQVRKRVVDLVNQGMNRGRKSMAYTKIMMFDLRNLLLKMSAIQATCDGREDVKVYDVENAFLDLQTIWELQLNFVASKIDGEIDYQNHIKPKLRECLIILDDNKCYSLEKSCLSIRKYDQLIKEKLGVSLSSARMTYRNKLKDMGLIDSKQIGKNDSRVWLTKAGYTLCHPNALNTLESNDKEN